MTSLTGIAPAGQTKLIVQGEHAITDDPDTIISTLLGSCVACCLWDDTVGVGGMNHLLLAGQKIGSGSGYDMAGVAEMEVLINAIIKNGGRRENLKAKVFGGAQMLETATQIGEDNARFAFDFLKQENIACINSSVGGTSARALRFWGATGRVNMRLLTETPPEPVAPPKPAAAPVGNDLELF
ncbi:chemotaxis protein CheD [Aliishimia ponticola]|uniref:Probable chemoreceptor glutamine deamidase CheD n=1 Tax=Aliishimia ponticola TaxID=2499833 RepID=A0A4V3XKW7_9RHOB|nr:chemotaxis protein CheD [Aliishimia ponticola]THH38583.1 chemotaxis protein CheD [Aliishimia ponticola]